MTTILDDYMKRAGISDADLGVQIGRDRSMVNKLRRGNLRPTLDVAAAIERATHGAVPMQSWTDTPDPFPPSSNSTLGSSIESAEGAPGNNAAEAA